MSQHAAAAIAPLPFELVYSDGEPLETEWHTWQYPLLRELIRQTMAEGGRNGFYVGGDMFVYYSFEQARDVARGRPYFRGPDVFWVDGVDSGRSRKAWVSWEEGGRLPDVIIELLSPSTAVIDRTVKKDLYAQVFRTSEYFLYEPETRKLEGFRLAGQSYRPLVPDGQGRLWSEQLGVFLGLWRGVYSRPSGQPGHEDDWVRLFRPDGSLVPTEAEAERLRAEAEHQRAEAEHRRAESESLRAEAAEAELTRLRALLQKASSEPQ
jgi:Uma2 family endonuclease